jgi:hypothetical protein
MQPLLADDPADSPHYRDRIHPALTNFADEVCATVARLFAYVGVLALFGILGIHAWDKLQVDLAREPAPQASWSVADRSRQAFALSPSGSSDKLATPETYVIFRHPAGGRKDVLRWSGPAGKALAELEIYRPGGEYPASSAARTELAERMLSPGAELESAGVIESKFGDVTLLRPLGAKDGPATCLGFFARIDNPALQLSGWSCQGDSLPARRADIGCLLNRLTPLTSENEPKLADLFARAELARGNCTAAGASADWMTSAENPRLRGTF